MYTFSIEKIKPNKEMKKSFRGILRNNYSFLELESIFKEAHEVVTRDTELHISAEDIEAPENNVVFDPIIIVPKERNSDILSLLKNDILNSDVEIEMAQEIAHQLSKQYIYEQTHQEPEEEAISIETNKTPAKNSNTSFFSKIKQSMSKKKSGADFEELDPNGDLEETDINQEDDFRDDFREIGHTEEKDDSENSNYSEENDEEEYEEEYSEEESDLGILAPVESVKETASEEKFTQVVDKIDTIAFPSIDEFVSLATIDTTLQRQTQRFEPEQLIKRLPLESHEEADALTKLDVKKIRYASQELKSGKFEALRDQISSRYANIVEEIKDNLMQEHNEAISFDYKYEAKSNKKEDIDWIYTEAKQDIQSFENRKNETKEVLISQKKEMNEEQVRQLQSRLQLELETYVNELTASIESEKELFVLDKNKESDFKVERILTDEERRLQHDGIAQLHTAKLAKNQHIIVAVEDLASQYLEEADQYLNQLASDISSKEPEWIQQIHMQEQADREERKLRLEEDKEARMRQQVNAESEKESTNVSESKQIIDREDEVRISEDSYSNYQPFPQFMNGAGMMATPPVANVAATVEKDSMRATLTGLFIGLGITAVLGCGWMIGRVGATSSETPVQVPEVVPAVLGIQQLEEKLDGYIDSKKDDNVTEVSTSNSDTIVTQQPEESKNENTITEEELISEDNSFEENFEAVYEAMAKRDIDKVVELVEAFNDEELSMMNVDRKESLALMLYQNEQASLANRLMEITSEK